MYTHLPLLRPSMMFRLLLIAVLVESLSHEKNLTKYLFDEYYKEVAPNMTRRRDNASDVIPKDVGIMRMEMILRKVVLLNVNEREGSVSVLINGVAGWIDPRLSWNPVEYDYIDEMLVRGSFIWLPFFRSCNSPPITPFISGKSGASIYSSGQVFVFFTQVVTFSCKMKFYNFPYDSQSCDLCFSFTGLMRSDLQLVDYDSVLSAKLNDSNEWKFGGRLRKVEYRRSELKHDEDYDESDKIVFHFNITRLPHFWTALLITPVSLITFVALVGIFFATKETVVESATTLGLTAVTALMLVVTILAENVAKTDSVPGVGWMSLAEIIVICVAVLLRITLDRVRSALVRLWEGLPAEQRGRKLTFAVSTTAHRAACCVLFGCCCVGVVLAKTLPWRD